MNEMAYITVAVRGIDRVIRVRAVWYKLREGSGSPSSGEYVRSGGVTQCMEHATKWWEGDDHLEGISVGRKRKVVVGWKGG